MHSEPAPVVSAAPRRRLHAFIDEAGQRGHSPKASKTFVLSAAVMEDDDLGAAADWLAALRADLDRRPGDTLHFQNLKSHAQRLHACKSLGEADMFRVISVIVCKDALAEARRLNDDQAYLYTFRLLLERLSWLARGERACLDYTLAHIIRFRIAKLRQYEANLRAQGGRTTVAWEYLAEGGGQIDQPNRIEMLQVADLAASATFQAFEPDAFGNTETRYLLEMLPCVWTYGTSSTRYTSYGLKVHPWAETTKAAHPWVATL